MKFNCETARAGRFAIFKLVQSQQAFIFGDNAFTTTRHLLRQGSQVAGN